MQGLALFIILVAGAWLIGVALLMAFRPATCLHLMEVMRSRFAASDWRLQIAEQGLRLLAGAALILGSPASKAPWLLWIFGWMIVASSLLILALPIRWHAAFGSLWLPRLTPRLIRLLCPVPLIAGCGLIVLVA